MWILYAIGSAFFVGITAILAKMWFHLKLLFAKNMRKAERALAFRISGSKCPFLTYLLLCYSSKSFANHRSDNHCNDHFAQIRRMKGMTQTASAAPTVYPAWRQNHAVPNA